MIVDDEPLSQVGLASMLDWPSIGVSLVGTSQNGERAFESIEALRPDIVITDVRMPVMGGLELIELCRSRMERPPAFIVLTAYADFESARRSLRLSAVDFLVKIELDAASLRASVERAKAVVDRGRGERGSPDRAVARPDDRSLALRRFLSGDYEDDGEALAALEREGFPPMAPPLCLAYARAEFPFPERLTEEDKDRAYRCAMDMAIGIAEREAAVVAGDAGERAFALILSFGPEAAECGSRARSILGSAAEMIEKFFGLSLAVALAPPTVSLRGLPGAFLAAREDASRKARTTAPPAIGAEAAEGEECRKDGNRSLLADSVRDYVDRNLHGKLAVADLAKAFRVSPNHLSTVFKRSTGIGFNEYVARAKVERAKELLVRPGRRMFEVALDLGFDDAFYFSKVFKRFAGCSPREFCQRSAADGSSAGFTDGSSAGSAESP